MILVGLPEARARLGISQRRQIDVPHHVVTPRLRDVARSAGPDIGSIAKITREAQAETRLLQTGVGRGSDQTTLLTGIQIGKQGFEFKTLCSTLKPDVCRLAVNFSAAAQRDRQQSDSVDCIALAAVVFADKDRQIFLELNLAVIEGTKVP